jgi:hypothetical protein
MGIAANLLGRLLQWNDHAHTSDSFRCCPHFGCSEATLRTCVLGYPSSEKKG